MVSHSKALHTVTSMYHIDRIISHYAMYHIILCLLLHQGQWQEKNPTKTVKALVIQSNVVISTLSVKPGKLSMSWRKLHKRSACEQRVEILNFCQYYMTTYIFKAFQNIYIFSQHTGLRRALIHTHVIIRSLVLISTRTSSKVSAEIWPQWNTTTLISEWQARFQLLVKLKTVGIQF